MTQQYPKCAYFPKVSNYVLYLYSGIQFVSVCWGQRSTLNHSSIKELGRHSDNSRRSVQHQRPTSHLALSAPHCDRGTLDALGGPADPCPVRASEGNNNSIFLLTQRRTHSILQEGTTSKPHFTSDCVVIGETRLNRQISFNRSPHPA